MRPSLKQWKQLMLIGIFAWALLFLCLFVYFTDKDMVEQAPSSLTYIESKGSAFIQGKQRVIMGAKQELSVSETAEDGNHFLFSDDILDSFNPRPESIKTWAELDVDPPKEKNLKKILDQNDKTYLLAAGQPKSVNRIKKQIKDAFQIGDVYDKENTLRNSHKWKRGQMFDSSYLEDFGQASRVLLYKLWNGDFSSRMLSPRLQKAMREYLNANNHGVTFKGKRNSNKLTADELLCELKQRAKVKTLDGKEAPFSLLGWEKHVPNISLTKLHPYGFRSCAVVSSAGAILNSSLGKEIDSHDAVLRFNSAPTEGYEQDVGNKTTVRVINSQILANPNHHFINNVLYKDVILVAWDPAPYSANLYKWYRKPDYDLFIPYVQYRKKYPDQPFYILHPRFIWELWNIIQENTREKIQPNPPSSGFIGILIMMSMCKEVHVYEYIPSIRQTDLCHYHEHYYDAACTLGAYHPLLYEKLLVRRMNKGRKEDLKRKGKVVLPGFSAITCSGSRHISQ